MTDDETDLHKRSFSFIFLNWQLSNQTSFQSQVDGIDHSLGKRTNSKLIHLTTNREDAPFCVQTVLKSQLLSK